MPSLPSCNHPRLSPVSYQILEKREEDTHPQIYERKDFWDHDSVFQTDCIKVYDLSLKSLLTHTAVGK